MTGKKKPATNLPKTNTKAAPPIRDAVRPEFYQSIAEILQNARVTAYRAVNFAMVEAYWNVGKMIVEEEQQGKTTAAYGEGLIHNLSVRLTNDFGKGFNVSNVFAFRQFYLSFSIFRAVRGISANDGQDTRNQETYFHDSERLQSQTYIAKQNSRRTDGLAFVRGTASVGRNS